MPTYEYCCRDCGLAMHYTASTPLQSTDLEKIHHEPCRPRLFGGAIKRVWGFSYIRPMQEGYNASVGKHISNMGQLKSEFARMSDEAEMYTGNPHKFVPIDPMDKETLGVTDEGLQATHDQQVAQGIKEPAQRLIFP